MEGMVEVVMEVDLEGLGVLEGVDLAVEVGEGLGDGRHNFLFMCINVGVLALKDRIWQIP